MIRKSALVALAAAALVAAPQAQAAEAAPSAGTWLVSQFADGSRLLRVPTDPASGDAGLTADGIYALAAAGVGKSTAVQAATWLAAPEQQAAFIGDGDSESYVGGLAKLALVAQTLGQDPARFGGVDLLKRLAGLESETGRFRDKTADPEFELTNTFTQALSIIVLQRAGLPTDKAVAYQAGTRCADAGFPIELDQSTCKSDVDATAIALQALLAAGEKKVSAGVLDWLEGQQQADGGFRAMDAPTNANTTGLAVGALVAGGRVAAADKAVAFLKTLQVGCADAQRGAISYDSKGFDAGTAVRATTQGALGLARVSLAQVSAEDATPGVPAIECAPTPPISSAPAPAGPEIPADPPLAVTGPDQAVPMTLFGSFAVVAGAALVFFARRRKVGA